MKKAQTYIRRFTSYLPTPENLLYTIRFFQICGDTKTIARHASLVYNLYLHPEKREMFNKTIYAVVPDGGMDNFFIEAFSDKEEFEKHNSVLERLHEVIIRTESLAVVKKILKGTIPIRAIDLRDEIPYLLSPVEKS